LQLKTDHLESILARCRAGEIGPYRQVHLPWAGPEPGSPSSLTPPFQEQARPALDGYRALDPVKILFYGVRDTVVPIGDPPSPRLLAGVKACDLKGLEVLDKTLLEGEQADPAYLAWRERTTVLSFDCTEVGPTCHCTLVGGKPFPESGFDAHAARVGDRYLLTAATPKGEAFLALVRAEARVEEEDETLRTALSARREKMISKVRAQNTEFARPEDLSRMRAASPERWAEESKECVGCGACTHVCPTCYCLILNDETTAEPFVKVRTYDSCQFHGYARVASGASPRPRLADRFRNRYLCKFELIPKQFGSLGCTGCGRCTEACAGGIEFRGVVRRVLEDSPPAGKPREAR
jgi:sulfhydrogenase subunit beta (sulfur reductase)